ncbi:uncharacterized protein BO97DRAFT_100484 [Aspergillus homomorphus CBS 101889]|uniref:Uncharacterized protein n=1 Tax=Aspergillus homomorphus (strain CBS 101889) TaxID=1450537 RepID=A0A395HYI3_ASPHC|nr:hypothetical protein BO97DRAFT_100484 [Aspergillus homomorphus CBS 101889]RAL11304.1 hypothetical protein BO97DRAFT_100484 [Aspergillus homomorphus CBS 101889]
MVAGSVLCCLVSALRFLSRVWWVRIQIGFPLVFLIRHSLGSGYDHVHVLKWVLREIAVPSRSFQLDTPPSVAHTHTAILAHAHSTTHLHFLTHLLCCTTRAFYRWVIGALPREQ